MQVHPDIAALRAHPAQQRRNKAVMEAARDAWLSGHQVEAVKRDFDRFAKGADLSQLRALHALLHDASSARGFVDSFTAEFCKALTQDPLAEAPFRHRSSDAFSRLQLLQTNGAMLSLCTYEPVAEENRAQTVQFVDCISHEIVVAGEARSALHRLSIEADTAPQIETAHKSLHPGDTLHLRANQDMRHIHSVTTALLVLQLTRAPERPGPSREYQLSDAALVRTTSGDKRASAQVMALGVLGALRQERSLAPMTGFALRGDGDPDARWEAVRQVLAMHSHEGMRLLDQLAGRASDILCAPASRLARQLRAQHPQLLSLEAQ